MRNNGYRISSATREFFSGDLVMVINGRSPLVDHVGMVTGKHPEDDVYLVALDGSAHSTRLDGIDLVKVERA